MSEITTSESVEITDPKLRALCRRAIKVISLAAERAVAHTADKAAHPIPSDASSFEQLVAGRLKEIHPARLQAAQVKVLAAQKTPLAKRATYADLGTIDLKSSLAVEKQVDARPLPANLKFTASDLPSLRLVGGGLKPVAAGGGMRPQANTDNLELRIHSVKCIDETDGFLGSESGSDEIALGGSTVDETGGVRKVAKMNIGDFARDGVTKTFNPPKRFCNFDLTEGTEFPKKYFVTMVLAEIDNGGFPSFLNNLMEQVKAYVKKLVKDALGSLGASGSEVNAIIGAAVAYIVDFVTNFFISIWEDDIFKPFTVSASIPSLNARWNGKTDSSEGTVTWTGHGGKYRVTYDWRVFA